MELRALRYFVTVAEELHFGRAAERLHIVQPAVSQQLAKLERELGVRLLDRSRRQVRLSQAGGELLGPARAALAAADQVRAHAARLNAAPGLLTVGTGAGFTTRLQHGISALRHANPELDLQLVDLPVTERLAAVRRGELNLALVRGLHSAPGLRVVPIWSEPLLAVLPACHPLAAREVLPLAELATIPLRFPSKHHDPPLHDVLGEAFRTAGLTPTLGRATGTVADTLVEIGTSRESWTLLPAESLASAGVSAVVGRPVEPALAVTGSIVAPADFTPDCVERLRAAFAQPDSAQLWSQAATGSVR